MLLPACVVIVLATAISLPSTTAAPEYLNGFHYAPTGQLVLDFGGTVVPNLTPMYGLRMTPRKSSDGPTLWSAEEDRLLTDTHKQCSFRLPIAKFSTDKVLIVHSDCASYHQGAVGTQVIARYLEPNLYVYCRGLVSKHLAGTVEGSCAKGLLSMSPNSVVQLSTGLVINAQLIHRQAKYIKEKKAPGQTPKGPPAKPTVRQADSSSIWHDLVQDGLILILVATAIDLLLQAHPRFRQPATRAARRLRAQINHRIVNRGSGPSNVHHLRPDSPEAPQNADRTRSLDDISRVPVGHSRNPFVPFAAHMPEPACTSLPQCSTTTPGQLNDDREARLMSLAGPSGLNRQSASHSKVEQYLFSPSLLANQLQTPTTPQYSLFTPQHTPISSLSSLSLPSNMSDPPLIPQLAISSSQSSSISSIHEASQRPEAFVDAFDAFVEQHLAEPVAAAPNDDVMQVQLGAEVQPELERPADQQEDVIAAPRYPLRPTGARQQRGH